MSIGNYPLSNHLIPLTLNDNTDVSGGNGVSVSESEVSGVPGVACRERVVWLPMRCKKRHKSPFLNTKKLEKSNRLSFNIHLFYNQ